MYAGSTYQVFLSFRGKDIRKIFIDHLYTALLRAGIRTFRDDDGIERGENIELELKKAIEQLRMSVVVLSEGYASSNWCLDELVKILEHKSTSGHFVLPVLYNVDPTLAGTKRGVLQRLFPSMKRNSEKKLMTEKNSGWRRWKGGEQHLKR